MLIISAGDRCSAGRERLSCCCVGVQLRQQWLDSSSGWHEEYRVYEAVKKLAQIPVRAKCLRSSSRA